MSKKKVTFCGCGVQLHYSRRALKWVCSQTGQLPENCNQVPRLEPVDQEPEPEVVESL